MEDLGEENFVDYVTRRYKSIKREGATRIPSFLYDHVGPCPQVSRDHPFGQAPVVLNIPAQENADWKKHVYSYYFHNMGPYWDRSKDFASRRWTETNGIGYAEIDDGRFLRLLTEGLYSKFLCSVIDDVDKDRFTHLITDTDAYEYWKSDYSCMTVVEATLSEVWVAPTVVLLRRPRGGDSFSVVAIAIACMGIREDGKAGYVWAAEPLVPTDGEAWRLAKYFVLQGAIHRINLIDHTRVHFPHDAINAITKTVLPKEHIVFQLLAPHLWLTLPVNYAVLEGEKSLINRETRQVYSPFAAENSEVRKLFPYGWYGAAYYDDTNSAFPPYKFDTAPPQMPSAYGNYLRAYYAPIRSFVGKVLEATMPLDDDNNAEWLDIQRWAEQIATWLPGFPYWRKFICPTPETRAAAIETLADVVALVIHNASVVHSADHNALHHMMDDDPVPFILRTEPPASKNHQRTMTPKNAGRVASIRDEVERVMNTIGAEEIGDAAGRVAATLAKHVLEPRFLEPLCEPGDLRAARYADLLFYMPHNSSLLIECEYEFKKDDRLRELIAQFQRDLRKVAADCRGIVELHKLPLLEPDPGLSDVESATVRATECIAASIQY